MCQIYFSYCESKITAKHALGDIDNEGMKVEVGVVEFDSLLESSYREVLE